MKRMMAISGLVFLFFVLFHAYGNLHYFEGEVAYDHYAVFLRALLVPIMPYGGVLWILRLALMACLLAHAGSAFHLWARNKRARGNDKYAVKKPGAEYFASRYAMRTMRWGGVILLLFIIWHLLQYTTLSLTPGGHYVHGVAHLRGRAGRPVPARVARRVVRPADAGGGARKHHPLHPADRLRAGLRAVRRLHGGSDGDPLRLCRCPHGHWRLLPAVL